MVRKKQRGRIATSNRVTHTSRVSRRLLNAVSEAQLAWEESMVVARKVMILGIIEETTTRMEV